MTPKWLFAAVILLFSATIGAQTSPEGRWKTFDDETGRARSIVTITRTSSGTLQGQVTEIIDQEHGPDPLCDQCTGANKGKPIKGLVILWGLRDEGGGQYAGGRILDPAKGKDYKAKLEMLGEDRLGVSGCIAFFCRQQEWVRE